MPGRRPHRVYGAFKEDQPMIRLDERLSCAFDMLQGAHAVADIGCDHGKLTAALLLDGSCDRVVAGDISPDCLNKTREIVERYGATVVLKGHETIVMSADGARVYLNQTGNPFMALGGMGDLLAGVIGARWAYLKGDPFLAAAASVWMHGAASDAIVAEALDPSIVQTAARIGSLRVKLDS